ncbi:MAG: hypothetical protein PHR07_09160 [Acidaminococcaceae bacterium]|nr:hypothetical protein [Acidaminococcaceae bacterium]
MKTYNAQSGTYTSGGVTYSDSKLTNPISNTTAPTAPTTRISTPIASTSGTKTVAQQIADAQQRAQTVYNTTGNWNDPTIVAMHDLVTRLQEGSGNVYDPNTGTWSTPKTYTRLTTAPTARTITTVPLGTTQPKAPFWSAEEIAQLTPEQRQKMGITSADMAAVGFNPGAQNAGALSTDMSALINSLGGGSTSGLSTEVQNILNLMMPDYTPRTSEQILSEAQQYADLLINPQVLSLEQAIEQARESANSRYNKINATYTSVPERTTRILDENAKKAQEMAIARGGGPSGVVPWLTKELQTPVLESMNQLEAERVAALNEISNALSLTESQGIEQMKALETQRGGYAEQQAKAIEELEYARQSGNWEKILEAALAVGNINSTSQANINDMLLGMMPYIQDTVEQENAANQGKVEVVGNTDALGPANTPNTQPVALRDYLAQQYGVGNVADMLQYTPSTTAGAGIINLGGVQIPISQLGSYGGYLGSDDRAYLPAATIERLLRSGL